MSPGRVVRSVLLLVVLGGLVVGAWMGWQAFRIQQSLKAASDDATALRAALSNDDQPGARAALTSLQHDSASAASHANGHTWSLLTHAPYVGDDARGVRTVSSVLDDLSRHALAPLVDSVGDLDKLLPRHGAVPLDAVRRLQQPVATADRTFARADAELGAHDPSGFVGPLEVRYRELADKVDQAGAALSSADTAVRLLPGMLGGDGQRSYLLVFQNNAEIRSTGGLPGAVSLLVADNGRLALSRQVAASSFGETPSPVLPLTPAETAIYGPQLGTFFLDANFTPDFPRAAALMKAHWEARFGGHIDGVFAVDPVALSYILGATGPVDVRSGVTITAADAVEQLLHQVYLTYPAPPQQDAFFRDVATAVFAKVAGGTDSTRGLLDALQRAADEHRLYVHSFDAREQKLLQGREISGELVVDPAAPPQVGVYLDDNTGAKMSYYLRTTVRVDATYCRNDQQGLSARATLQSTAPTDVSSLNRVITGGGRYGIPAGSQLVAVHIYAPVGGTLTRVTLNSRPVQDVSTAVQDGRKVATIYVFLKPQHAIDLAWNMTTGTGQRGPIQVTVTPGVDKGRTSFATASAC